MDTQALVSVIIPVFNGSTYLADALRSVLCQSYMHLEIIVIEDGSAAPSDHIVAQFPQVTYVPLPHMGNAAARNHGITISHGQFIAFLDQDDRFTVTKIADQLRYAQGHTNTMVVSGLTKEFVEPGMPVPSWVRAIALEESHRGSSPGTWLIRRETFENIGMFDKEYQMVSDTEWLYRLKQHHLGYHVLPKIVLEKRIHQKNQSGHQSKELIHQYHQELLTMLKPHE